MWLCICQMRQWDQIPFWGKNCFTEYLILKEQGLIVSKLCWIPINAGISVTFPFESWSTESILINSANLQPLLRQNSAYCHRLQNNSCEHDYGLQPPGLFLTTHSFYTYQMEVGFFLYSGCLSSTWCIISIFRWSTAFIVVAYTYLISLA